MLKQYKLLFDYFVICLIKNEIFYILIKPYWLYVKDLLNLHNFYLKLNSNYIGSDNLKNLWDSNASIRINDLIHLEKVIASTERVKISGTFPQGLFSVAKDTLCIHIVNLLWYMWEEPKHRVTETNFIPCWWCI